MSSNHALYAVSNDETGCRQLACFTCGALERVMLANVDARVDKKGGCCAAEGGRNPASEERRGGDASKRPLK